jgi:hypothetical protein
VARFHVTVKGSTFVDKEHRFDARKRKVISKKTKTSGEQAHCKHFRHFQNFFPLFIMTLEKKWSIS